ncbi:MAG: hypothetical protein R8M70_01160 [Alphaproteobacteria bacterium]|nr:hypothetical protein [Alphaproteobacteria bacterium]
MKKTWFLAVLCCFFVAPAVADDGSYIEVVNLYQGFFSAQGCQPVNCGTSGGNDTINADTLTGATYGATSCYVCEKGYCEDGDVVYKPDFTAFRKCNQGGFMHDDKWEVFTPKLCSDKPNYSQFLSKKGHGLEKVWVVNGKEHKDGEKSGDNTTLFATGSSICYYYKCIDGLGWNAKLGKCNSNNNGYIGKCHPSVCKSEICKACCAKPASETIWDRTAQACQCVNGGNFTKENNQWFCKVNAGQDGVTTKCDETLMSMVAEWKTKCANHTTVLSEIEQLESYCKAKPTKDVFLRLYDDLKNTVEKSCIKTSTNTTVDITTQITKVNNAYSQLTAIHNKFRDKVSVWKDAEGNFNTARLASDTVAGVVLGTTGALVTSHVVKKNQVENGFEDIKCTIGGQNVAGWGDQFRVGIQ